MLIFVAIKPVMIDVTLASALQGDNAEELLKATAPLVRAFTELEEWAVNEGGGRVLCKWGEFFVMEVPVDRIDKFAQFNKRWEMTSKLNFAVGIGGTPMEAFYAMEASEGKGGESIVLFSDDLEATMEDASPVLSKTDDVMDFSFPNLNLDEVEPQQPQQQQAPQPQGQDALKAKVVQTLMQLKQVAPLIGQMKDANPDVYVAIKSLIDSMLEMAKQGQPAQQPQAAEPPKAE